MSDGVVQSVACRHQLAKLDFPLLIWHDVLLTRASRSSNGFIANEEV